MMLRLLTGAALLATALAAVAAEEVSGTAAQAEAAEAGMADSSREPAAAELSVEEILTTPSTEEYVNTPRCISTHRIRQVHVLDASNIVFEMRRDSYYLVQFRHRCPQLEPRATIFYDVSDQQLCRLDSIRPLIGISAAARVGPPCQIPGFKEINRAQFLLVRETLKHGRRGPDLVDQSESDEEPDEELEKNPH